MSQASKFWDKNALKYAAAPIRDQQAYAYTLERTRRYLNAEDKVLEIGCGTGSTALLLAPNVAQFTGTDISPGMLRIAREKAAEQGAQNLGFHVATAAQAAHDAAGMNVVLGFNIFHLTEDLEGILASLSEILEPGALLITKTPCLSEPSIGIKRFLFGALIPVMQLVGKAPFVRKLSFADLEALITAAGFEIIEAISKPSMSRYLVARRKTG
ncbi:methyltransferase domain-containing protein [Sulfitobacter sp. M57]|uniref:class I SAM-dependent methyltransferase n=1 Tax=unclassified Sulfitobacter TaxID=196795 RepID=UPI0023E1C0C6|nr:MULTISPECIES: class I SAM-dependent methyltransferase [unclassified Sulfitobacter]MDF3416309.1 methyltransferase domain-containing protein [Sulfitobacter sp. KE5]MDF3423788.1 methyltransferase domain-containing protein [Sulfitobacter sp. KE43]MDF3434855.1 methyltransferase domain-containing protein [Sulfitobacter sp. KE42]MDF3460494.1 methyltransferase domain-containing protein [Sulfitobacter sp. S74]MDF3464392.1 methyltransferase domain-containing protein [Sulfitobacter sp. Ks18]